jgi:hypothetical protein
MPAVLVTAHKPKIDLFTDQQLSKTHSPAERTKLWAAVNKTPLGIFSESYLSAPVVPMQVDRSGKTTTIKASELKLSLLGSADQVAQLIDRKKLDPTKLARLGLEYTPSKKNPAPAIETQLVSDLLDIYGSLEALPRANGRIWVITSDHNPDARGKLIYLRSERSDQSEELIPMLFDDLNSALRKTLHQEGIGLQEQRKLPELQAQADVLWRTLEQWTALGEQERQDLLTDGANLAEVAALELALVRNPDKRRMRELAVAASGFSDKRGRTNPPATISQYYHMSKRAEDRQDASANILGYNAQDRAALTQAVALQSAHLRVISVKLNSVAATIAATPFFNSQREIPAERFDRDLGGLLRAAGLDDQNLDPLAARPFSVIKDLLHTQRNKLRCSIAEHNLAGTKLIFEEMLYITGANSPENQKPGLANLETAKNNCLALLAAKPLNVDAFREHWKHLGKTLKLLAKDPVAQSCPYSNFFGRALVAWGEHSLNVRELRAQSLKSVTLPADLVAEDDAQNSQPSSKAQRACAELLHKLSVMDYLAKHQS